MTTLLAQAAAAAADSSVNWTVVTALGVLASLAANAAMVFRFASGKANERKIEPTQLGAIQTELKTQTVTLNKLDREVGEVKTKVEGVEKSVDGFHTRVGGISRELAATTARVEGLEKRERLA